MKRWPGRGGTGPRRAGARSGLAWREAVTGYLFLLPVLGGLAVFRFYGFGYNVWLSFRDAGAFGAPVYTGADNYRKLLNDSQLGLALVNTVKFAAIAVPGVVVVALLMAISMQCRFRGDPVFRAIVFLPAVCLPTALVLVFAWMFQTQFGIVNAALHAIGVAPVSWFGSAAGVTTVVSLLVVYLSFSVPAVILYAAIQDISPELYEAAKLDGAGPGRRFFAITLPLLTPALFFVILITTIGTLKLFDVVFILLPPDSVSVRFGFTLVYYYWFTGFFSIGQRGYAAAISVFLLLLIMAVSIVLLRIQRRFIHYGEDG